MKRIAHSNYRALKIILVTMMAVILGFGIVPFIAPQTFDVSAAPAEYNLTVEYGYIEGQDAPQVPQTISRFGRNYNLIQEAEPVLARTLPVNRNYNFKIDGIMTQDQINELLNTEGLVVKPIPVEMDREVDKFVTYDEVSWNDVDALPQEADFEVSTAIDADGNLIPISFDNDGKVADGVGVPQLVTLKIAGAKFDVSTDDANGLPLGYTAETVYRGLETYAQAGYFEATQSYGTKTSEDVDSYIIQAVYELVDLPAGTTYPGGGTPTTPGTTATPAAPAPVVVPVAPAPGAAAPGGGAGAPVVAIPDEDVPLTAGDDDADDSVLIEEPEIPLVPSPTAGNTWALFNLLFAVFGGIAAVIAIVGIVIRNKKEPSSLENSTESDRKLSGTSLSLITIMAAFTIILAVANVILFFATQDISNPMVMTDGWTILSAVFVLAEVIVALVAYKVSGDSESPEAIA
jgi:hypothetical protein